jgi:predicted ribosomally synthesized peptide with nif11-like leader
MSVETVKQFLQAVDKSPELQRQIEPVQGDERPENLKKIAEIANKAGYSITQEDLMAEIRMRAQDKQSGEQLSESDLEKVAGGAWCILTCWRTS